MNARKKLNTAHIYGALLVAAVVGVAFESWLVFLIVGGGFVFGAVYAGDIRPVIK